MNIKIAARHFNASESLQATVQEMAEKLVRFYPEITDVSVVLDAEKKNLRRAEFNVNILHRTVSGRSEAENMGKALDQALEKIMRQLKKENEKLKSHKAQPVAEVVA